MSRAQIEALRDWLSSDEALYVGSMDGDTLDSLAERLFVHHMRVDDLLPAENMALTIALAQIERGDEVPPNTTAVLIWALARQVGREVTPARD